MIFMHSSLFPFMLLHVSRNVSFWMASIIQAISFLSKEKINNNRDMYEYGCNPYPK